MTIEFSYACIVAFGAGLVDAIAGGGGLIQIPGLLLLFPNVPIVTLLGTNKLASFCGTFMSSWHFVRTLKINFKALLPTLIASFLSSIVGAKVVSTINNHSLKPIIIILLTVMAGYTLWRKDLGMTSTIKLSGIRLKLCCIAIGMAMGFYDGFFGPGAGSILIFCFVGILGFSFLEGSAFSKLTNLASNLAAMIYFASSHHILYTLAIPMAVCNVLGNLVGARLAIKKGSGFVRWVFLVVILGILIQFTYSSFFI